MKIIIQLIAFLVFTFYSTAQTNTFPADGNVGIGTTTPEFKLDISFSNAGVDGFRLTNTNSGVSAQIQNQLKNNAGSLGYTGISSSNYSGFAPLDGGQAFFGGYNLPVSIFTQTAHPIIFYTNITEKMRISATGNVGIGTASPTVKLDIAGNDIDGIFTKIMNSGSTGTYPYFVMGQGGSTAYGIPSWQNSAVFEGQSPGGLAFGSYAGDIKFYANTSRMANMVIQNGTGNFGIGTTNPESKLNVKGGASTFQNDGANQDNPTIRLINNNAPTNNYGEYRADISVESATGSLVFRNVTGKGYDFISSPHNASLLNISDGGHVGIGTTNTNDPNYKLFVETGIRTRKIKVDQTNWPDYVFNKNYKLPSLTEIEKYIKENKHLPEIPTAKNIEQNGVDLGYNQALLLKKIEELTLIVIDLKKEIEQVKSTKSQKIKH